MFLIFFFFNDTAPTEIYTLSLHDALPISGADCPAAPPAADRATRAPGSHRTGCVAPALRPGATAAGDGDPPSSGGVGQFPIRHGNAGRDEANAERESWKAVPRNH